MMGDERVQTLQLAVEINLKRQMQRQVEILGEELRLEILRQARRQQKGGARIPNGGEDRNVVEDKDDLETGNDVEWY